MTSTLRSAAAIAALAAAILGTAPAFASTVVFCAPNFPGTTAEAQPAMDAFAAAVARASGLAPTDLHAAYFETEETGATALGEPDAAVAIVTFPFWVARGAELDLKPRLQAVPRGGAPTEAWRLVARKGRVASPDSLAGWQIAGTATYAPGFVRDWVLKAWGPLPADVRWQAAPTVLSFLRRAAAGENVAVLLDGAQYAGLASLPFAADLGVVATSEPVPASVVCTVGKRLDDATWRRLAKALQSLHEAPDGAAALEGLRLDRFVPTSLGASR